MKKYTVDLIRHTILDRREVEAESEQEAKDKAMPTFNKVDIDDYDDVWVEEKEDDEE